ncbi:hypothetical protein [Enterococcus sp.]|uniref:hypothetical protein n=1 Tax=Enterococcus sp. TaxID=35783 RepID=UPI0028984BA6|nr:hypothetical protein [Enterococcus sp.]
MAKKKQELKVFFHLPDSEEKLEELITYYFVTALTKPMKEALAELEAKELSESSSSEPKQNEKV